MATGFPRWHPAGEQVMRGIRGYREKCGHGQGAHRVALTGRLSLSGTRGGGLCHLASDGSCRSSHQRPKLGPWHPGHKTTPGAHGRYHATFRSKCNSFSELQGMLGRRDYRSVSRPDSILRRLPYVLATGCQPWRRTRKSPQMARSREYAIRANTASLSSLEMR